MKKLSKILKRKCVVCGKTLTIKVYKNGHYTGGHYFSSTLDGKKLPASREFWECDKCSKKS